MAVTIRTIGAGEQGHDRLHDRLHEWTALKQLVYGQPRPTEGTLAYDRVTFEPDRSFAAFDAGTGGERMIGTAATASHQVSMPGGDDVAMGGVRAVSVAPTHRRRGVLTALMDRVIDDARQRGEPLLGLWASEAPIYRRFGFGPATFLQRWKVARPTAGFARPVAGLDVQLLPDDIDAIVAAIAPVHDRLRTQRAGMVARDDRWWRRRLDGRGTERVWAAGARDGVPVAYAGWSVQATWKDTGPANHVTLHEIAATTPDAYASMLRFVLDIDLVATVEADYRPPDDPLPWLLADRGRIEAHTSDALWIRPLDIGAALASRRYRSDAPIVLQIGDRQCPWNEGPRLLEAGAAAPTDAKPDLELDVADLGSLLLGGVAATDLVLAGLVRPCTPDAAARADTIFGWRPLPWCPTYF